VESQNNSTDSEHKIKQGFLLDFNIMGGCGDCSVLLCLIFYELDFPTVLGYCTTGNY